ncbi:hypothetical protein GALMADRAFT_150280 [Galerina marginata CBS 339.88]|uniref:Autophagy-related protein 27 n=1 Tax=Galerina marginata (strain CBS 339.88) TaxID=685588 RepID=A0A067U3C0_GALM3|nr:hypothetical protein GALMADRAFT_150280 [Galerina marginata CBS 339.88]
MMFGQRTALLLLCFLYSGVWAEEKPCTTHDNGKYYDLNPLKASKDYEVKTSTGEKLHINVCQSVRTEVFGLKEDMDAADVGGFVRRAHGDFVIGKLNTSLTIFDSQPRFVLSSGSRCKPKPDDQPTEIRASSVIEFICDTSVFGPGTPRLLARLPPGDDEIGCAYVIEWRTHYACPTSEGGGITGFFVVVGIIFLVLLLTYTVLGTLYNRFVLQLRGFDQIPQFSIESMKYHGREAVDWIKDMIAALDIGGSRRAGGHSYGSQPSSGIRTTNPVSHQSQVSGFGNAEGLEEGGPLGGGGFVRPPASRNPTRPSPFQRAETNPISHQTQVNAQSLSFSQSPRSSQSPPQQPQQRVPLARTLGPGSTQEERDFMLADDDDDDAQELGDFSAPPPLPSSPAPNMTRTPSTNNSVSPEPNAAAVARGRDLGGGDATLL